MRRIRVDVGREQRHRRRQVFLQPRDVREEERARVAVLVAEDVAAVFVSTTLWWMCMALPGSRAIGLAMNVAYILWRKAASRAVRLNMNTWSASDSASPCSRLISICAAPSSWISVSISMSCASQNA
jgi:hypothetical protein